MDERGSGYLNEDSMEIAILNEGNADFSQAEAAPGLLEVRPSFLHALGLMAVTTKEIKAISIPLSESRSTDIDKNVGGSHTSVSKKLKSKSASSTAKKTYSVKSGHVSKPKKDGKKRSHAKPTAPTTDKPSTKKEPHGMKRHQHKASPPGTKVSPSERKSTVKAAADLSELSSTADDVRLWSHISESDFKSMEFRTLLKNNQFTEEQTEAIQKSFQYLCRTFCSGPISFERFMKTHQCIDCDFSISHECMAMNSTEYWTFEGIAPCIESITPELTIMCLCGFAFYHSHKPQLRSKSKSVMPSPLPSTFHWVPDNRTFNWDCPKCCMRISITDRNNRVCSDMTSLNSIDGPIRKQFVKYVICNLEYERKQHPVLTDFYSCSSLCCMLFHRCDENVLARSFMPIQNHRPLLCCPVSP
ncbi:uncharacterized protein LOC135074724 [Ostrinia nubilalis]|uniref:uncharacterized protein LOC135074724 n=1 Tax=Ostrinia nubilalis TaxID=29057 RepID=UPI00308244AC